MFGHSPAPVARAIAGQASRGLHRDAAVHAHGRGRAASRTLLSPAALADHAQRQRREPLPVLRWARAITGRPRVLVFDGCYHGTVDDTWSTWTRAAARPHARQPARPGARSRARRGGRSLQRHRRGGLALASRRRGLRADRAGADELRPGAAAAGFSRATAARLRRAHGSLWCSTRRTPSAAAGAGMRASRNSSRLHGDRQGDRRRAACVRYTASAEAMNAHGGRQARRAGRPLGHRHHAVGQPWRSRRCTPTSAR